MIYKCEICNKEFHSENECKEHENVCGSRKHLIDVIHSQQEKIKQLENEINRILRRPIPTYISPYEWPDKHVDPHPIWCNSNPECNLIFEEKQKNN